MTLSIPDLRGAHALRRAIDEKETDGAAWHECGMVRSSRDACRPTRGLDDPLLRGRGARHRVRRQVAGGRARGVGPSAAATRHTDDFQGAPGELRRRLTLVRWRGGQREGLRSELAYLDPRLPGNGPA